MSQMREFLTSLWARLRVYPQPRHEVSVRIRVANQTGASMLLRIEPWGNEVSLPAAATHDLEFSGPDVADIEIRAGEAELTVYGWSGSDLDRMGLPVPPTPPVRGDIGAR
jgi:hypothetical protein